MKKLFVALLCAVLLLSVLLLSACTPDSPDTPQGEESTPDGVGEVLGSEGLTYELNWQGNGYIVTGKGTCTDKRVVIPSTYNGLPVLSIGNGAFSEKTPPSDNNQSGGTTNDKDKKGLGVFAFGTRTLSSITSSISFSLLSDTSATDGDGITEVVIPDSVMDIGDNAFYGCESLASFEVSNLVNLIGTDAFKDTAYYLDESNWTGDALYLEEYLVAVRPTVVGEWVVRDGTVNIASNAFEGCVGITSVSFPSSLRFVGKMAFMGCTGITEIDLTIPGIQIENYAFKDCTSLTTIIIGTDDIPNAPPVESFWGVGLEGDAVFMPGGVSDIAFNPEADPNYIYSGSIGHQAFCGCTSLTSVTLGSNIGYLGGFIFEGCSALKEVDLSMIKVYTPDTVIVTPGYNHRWHMSLQGIFKDCTSLVDIKLPEGIVWLDRTFEGCTSITEFVVPDTVKGLNGTFTNCSSLLSVSIPESVVALSKTFLNCSALREITLPQKLVKIGDETFFYCNSLIYVYVPDSVTEIGNQVFVGNPEIGMNVSFGKGVEKVFDDCVTTADAIVFRGTVEEWKKSPFYNKVNCHNPLGEGSDVICTDGTIIGDDDVVDTMKGIKLSDGTLYVSFKDVTFQYTPGVIESVISRSIDEIEAELVASGSTSWTRVKAIDLLQTKPNRNISTYGHIREMIQ